MIAFSGPKEGVGNSTVCMNLALAWAGTQSRNVIIIHLDPLCRHDVADMLGVQPPSLASLTQLIGSNLAGLLKGRIPLSQWGVGVLPLAANRAGALSVSPRIIVPILAALSESYDLFIDVDPYFPMQLFSFALADLTFWMTLPQRAHFEATYNLFNDIKASLPALAPFEIVVNQANLTGALAPKEVERFFAALNRRVLSNMPWEDLLPEYANTRRLLVAEQPHSNWIAVLRPLLGRLSEVKPTIKQWNNSALDELAASGGGTWGMGHLDSSLFSAARISAISWELRLFPWPAWPRP